MSVNSSLRHLNGFPFCLVGPQECFVHSFFINLRLGLREGTLRKSRQTTVCPYFRKTVKYFAFFSVIQVITYVQG